jgi:polysaccharide deacetylase family protein (PEP-CTERM system associated)
MLDSQVRNIITIDYEDLLYANLLCEKIKKDNKEFDRLERSTNVILEILENNNTKATFFVVGKIAEKYPQLIERIIKCGHHIGSHSYNHSLVYNMTPSEFNQDLKKSISILENIINRKVECFRAPSWSYSNKINSWYWDILKQNNIKIDSSIFPTKNFLYGDPKAPRFINKRENNIIEIPPSTIKIFGKNIPFSGGFYLRIFPYFVIKRFIRVLNKLNVPVVVYVHPWEFDAELDVYKDLPRITRLITYYNISSNAHKLDKLLKDFNFYSIDEYLQN